MHFRRVQGKERSGQLGRHGDGQCVEVNVQDQRSEQVVVVGDLGFVPMGPWSMKVAKRPRVGCSRAVLRYLACHLTSDPGSDNEAGQRRARMRQ